ncbi:MAG TPA: dTDP-4-dehydrorhamnose reductase [Bacteroidetes bacterium]|nr:dTDP-4-dehydrorhamnose reductase [Bacteroidota bacterium]
MKKEKTNILVTGSKGQVGQELKVLAGNFPHFYFEYIDVEELDITDAAAVLSFFEKNKFDYCINCAAYTAVDKAESQKEIAHKVNAVGVKNLSEGCKMNNSKLIQLSTDYVYHNNQNTPFKEGDKTNPQGVYASTKLEGDHIALSGGGMVIRTSWVYSSFGNNFVKTMIRLGNERDELGIIFDQIGTPTYAFDLAEAILKIIQKFENKKIDKNNFSEIYHFSNEGVTSWYDFAKAIFEMENIPVKVKAIETKDYPTPAKRPPFSVLNKNKIKQTFGLEIPYWRDGLRRCLKKLNK